MEPVESARLATRGRCCICGIRNWHLVPKKVHIINHLSQRVIEFLGSDRQKKSFDLEGKLITPCQGNTILFCYSQQLPCLHFRPLKGILTWHPSKGPPLTRLLHCFWNYIETRSMSGVEVPGHCQEQLTKSLIVVCWKLNCFCCSKGRLLWTYCTCDRFSDLSESTSEGSPNCFLRSLTLKLMYRLLRITWVVWWWVEDDEGVFPTLLNHGLLI